MKPQCYDDSDIHWMKCFENPLKYLICLSKYVKTKTKLKIRESSSPHKADNGFMWVYCIHRIKINPVLQSWLSFMLFPGCNHCPKAVYLIQSPQMFDV